MMKKLFFLAFIVIICMASAMPVSAEMSLTSSVVKEGDTIPDQYSRAGAKQGLTTVSPPLKWTGAPAGTKAFAVIGWNSFLFWAVYNIPGDATGLSENAQGIGKVVQEFITPQEDGPGDYTKHITVYALSAEVKASEVSDVETLRAAMKPLTLGSADLSYHVLLD